MADSVNPDPIAIDFKSSYNFSNKSILIVEDDIYNAEFLKEVLLDTGVKITHTLYGYEAVEMSLASSFDMILMDIALPDMSGFDITQKLISNNPDLKIIAQTAYASPEHKQKALEVGCIDFISKPLKRDLLLAMINKYLS